MNSFLEEIGKYIEEAGFPFKQIYINFNLLPTPFQDAICYYMSKDIIFKSQAYDKIDLNVEKPEGFYIHIEDSEDKKIVCLSIINPITKENIIIKPNEIHLEEIRGFFINEEKFLETARRFDDKKFYELLKKIDDEEKRYIISENAKDTQFGLEIVQFQNRIKDYIKYLFKEYRLKTTKMTHTPYEKDSESKDIITRERTANSPKERKNRLLSHFIRRVELDKHKSILDTISYSDQKDKDNPELYYVKVFKTINNKITIVMEPRDAQTYTKIAHIDSDKINQKEVEFIVKEVLAMSNKEITQAGYVTRHAHTTLENYRNLLDYLLKGIDDNMNPIAIEKIENAREHAKRIG